MYKDLFEKLKTIKKMYFQNKLKKCENNIKNTWKIIKFFFGKVGVQNDSFPKRFANNEITGKKFTAEKFNMAQWILSHIFQIFPPLFEKILIRGRVQKCFFYSKDKSPGYDNIHINVIRNLYYEQKTP